MELASTDKRLDFSDTLFVTEVGSRMWGMTDISSDHDMFVCYKTPASEYLRNNNFGATLPSQPNVIIGETEFDFQYMEIGHLVNLLCKGNINAIWAVCSPIVHKSSIELEILKETVLATLSQASYDSIRGMAMSEFKDAEKRKKVRSPEKSLKTCLRTLWFGCSMLQGCGLDFSAVREATEKMCQDEFERLEVCYIESRLPEKPDRARLQDYLYRVRMNEIIKHNIVIKPEVRFR